MPSHAQSNIHLAAFVALILTLALGLRLFNIDASPNYDSLASLAETDNTNLGTVLDYLSLDTLTHVSTLDKSKIAHEPNFSFPGYYLLNRAYMAVTGAHSLEELRVLTALLSFLTVLVITILAWHMIGPHGAVAAVLLGTFSPLLQYYGSYVRFYAAETFFSALAYAVTLAAVSSAGTPDSRARHPVVIAGLCLLIWLPLTVHAAGAFPLFICSYLVAVHLLPNLTLKKRAYAIGVWCLLGVPVVANALVFVFARVTDLSPGSVLNVMSASVASLLGSLVFNFNGLVFLTIAFAVCVVSSSRLRVGLLYLPFALCLGGAFVLIVTKHELFRPDYLSSVLPISYFICADAIEQVSTTGASGWRGRSVGYLVLCFVLLFSLPSFASNAFIDQDGLRFDLAMIDIKALQPGKRVLVYTFSPGYFPADPEGRLRFAQFDQEGIIDEAPYNAVMYAVGWRREGFDKTFYLPEARMADMLKRSRLRKISGRPRLDMRDNLTFIFEKDAARGSETDPVR